MITLEVMFALKAQLQESLPGVVVDYCPARPGDYLRQTGVHPSRLDEYPAQSDGATGEESAEAFDASQPPVVLLRYCGCSYSEPGGSLDALVQSGEFCFETLLLVDDLDADLHGLVGAIGLLDRVRSGLLGFKPPRGGRVRLKKEYFGEGPDGDWQYRLEFLVDGTVIQKEFGKDAE